MDHASERAEAPHGPGPRGCASSENRGSLSRLAGDEAGQRKPDSDEQRDLSGRHDDSDGAIAVTAGAAGSATTSAVTATHAMTPASSWNIAA